jgi:hypothetical protein
LLALEEPQEEAPQEQEQAPEALVQASVPPQPEPEPEEEPELILIEDEEEDDADGGEQPPSLPHDEATEDDVPPPPIGWTVKIYHKARGDSVSHHRLVGMLTAYFADWNPAVEYVCWEYTHSLEDTYWKSRASIFPRDEEKGAYQLDRMYSHMGCRATMEASIEDTAFEACMGSATFTLIV